MGQDTVFLRNGRIVVGTVVEHIVGIAVRLKLEDGRQVAFLSNEVGRVESHGSALRSEPPDAPGTALRPIRPELKIYMGGAIPVGAFGNAEGAGAGAAQIGGLVGFSLSDVRSGVWIYGVSVTYGGFLVSPAAAAKQIGDPLATKARTGPWSILHPVLFAGIKRRVVSLNTSIVLEAGLVRAGSPEITLTRADGDATHHTGRANGLALGTSVTLQIVPKWDLRLRYATASTRFDYVVTSPVGSVATERSQQISFLQVLIGLRL